MLNNIIKKEEMQLPKREIYFQTLCRKLDLYQEYIQLSDKKINSDINEYWQGLSMHRTMNLLLRADQKQSKTKQNMGSELDIYFL